MPGRVATRFARPAYLAPCRAGRPGRHGFQSVNKSGATVAPNTADRPDSPMLIVCPTCATSYDVELASLQPNGRQVRCVRCRTIWRAAPSHAAKLLAAAEAIGPEPQVAQAPEGAFAEEPALQSADEQIVDGGAWAAPDELPGRRAGRSRDGYRHRRARDCSAVEVEAPSIAPVDLDDGQPPIEVETHRRAGRRAARGHRDLCGAA